MADLIGVPVDVRRIRVMFSDGEVQDYLVVRDDSNFRGFAFEQHFGRKSKGSQRDDNWQVIAGVSDLGVVYTHTPEIVQHAHTVPPNADCPQSHDDGPPKKAAAPAKKATKRIARH